MCKLSKTEEGGFGLPARTVDALANDMSVLYHTARIEGHKECRNAATSKSHPGNADGTSLRKTNGRTHRLIPKISRRKHAETNYHVTYFLPGHCDIYTVLGWLICRIVLHAVAHRKMQSMECFTAQGSRWREGASIKH